MPVLGVAGRSRPGAGAAGHSAQRVAQERKGGWVTCVGGYGSTLPISPLIHNQSRKAPWHELALCPGGKSWVLGVMLDPLYPSPHIQSINQAPLTLSPSFHPECVLVQRPGPCGCPLPSGGCSHPSGPAASMPRQAAPLRGHPPAGGVLILLPLPSSNNMARIIPASTPRAPPRACTVLE